MFLIQPAVAESIGDWSISSEMALKDVKSPDKYTWQVPAATSSISVCVPLK